MGRRARAGRVAATAIALGLGAAGCGAIPVQRSVGSADCAVWIRADGVVFEQAGVSRQPARHHGVAVESECEDVGPDARGVVFTDESRRLTTYRFVGFPPDGVLGVHLGGRHRLEVFVARSLGDRERARLLRALAASR
ncbi:MAG: hypothetical protein U0R80_15325 [Nocardioidaceae bacterium]